MASSISSAFFTKTPPTQSPPFQPLKKLRRKPQFLFPKYPSSFPKCPRISCSSAGLIAPDGGKLVELVVPEGAERESRRREASGLARVKLSRIDLEWVHVLSEGWASPLGGFMRESEFLQTLHFNAIRVAGAGADGSVVNMSVPIVLAIDDAKKAEIGNRSRVVLVDHNNKPVAILNE